MCNQQNGPLPPARCLTAGERGFNIRELHEGKSLQGSDEKNGVGSVSIFLKQKS